MIDRSQVLKLYFILCGALATYLFFSFSVTSSLPTAQPPILSNTATSTSPSAVVKIQNTINKALYPTSSAMLRNMTNTDAVFHRIKSALLTMQLNSKESDWLVSLCDRLWRDEYTRIQLYNSTGKVNVLLLCWSEHARSPIHSHGGSMCFIKVIQHELHERLFAVSVDGGDTDTAVKSWEPLSASVVKTGEVSYMYDIKGLHDISVPAISSGIAESLRGPEVFPIKGLFVV